MAQHKWHKEIKAWADGAEIEEKYVGGMCIKDWTTQNSPAWHTEIGYVYRIKPQHKEPQYPFKGMCEIPYKHWVLRFYQMPNDLWYSEGMDDAWMKEMVEASKPQPKEPQYIKLYGWLKNENIKFHKEHGPYLGKIKLEVDDGN